MSRTSKILMLVASLILIGAYFTPLWNIYLHAPQYPEGLGLQIRIDTVTGQQPNDIDKINNLNHYIGMKTIEPDTIPELRIMPYIIGFMILFGLITAFARRRQLIYLWTALFIIIGIAGMVDFYIWTYDYGHNLDTENAIIKVPGMTYQPPILGSKQLLNFTAVSLPGVGGYIVLVSMLLGMIASWIEFRKTRNQGRIPAGEAEKKTSSDSAALNCSALGV